MHETILPFIQDETSALKTVVLGHSLDKSPVKHINNPKYAETLEQGKEASDEQLMREIERFAELLDKHGVKVLRPENVKGCTQIFPRDIGFVIDDVFVVANMFFENRNCEFSGINKLVEQFPRVLYPPADVQVEGGDVVLCGDIIFVGIGQRTNFNAVEFLQTNFKDKIIVPLHLVVTNDANTNILHLDCAFQPVGGDNLIIYEEGLEEIPEVLSDIFPDQKRIKVSQKEMYDMVPNIFSIATDKVVIEENFSRLSKELVKRNIEPLPLAYHGVSRLGGLLRCSTLPLERVRN